MGKPNLLTTLTRVNAPFIPLQSKVLTSATSSFSFSGLDTTPFPLFHIGFSLRNDTLATSIGVRCNGDSGANYQRLALSFGNGAYANGRVKLYTQTLTPASVAANSTAEQSFTVTGLTGAGQVSVSKPTHQSGLGIVNARTSATNTLNITFVNTTASPIVPTSESYKISELENTISNSGISYAAKETAQESFIATPLLSTSEFIQGSIFIQQHPESLGQKVGLFCTAATNTPDFHFFNGNWDNSSAKLTSLTLTGMVTHSSAFGSFGAGSRFILSGISA